MPFQILLIEDDEEDYHLIVRFLARARGSQYELLWAATYEEGQRFFEQIAFDAILVDYSLGKHTGLEFIQEIIQKGSLVPAILLTGQGNLRIDLQAMQAGAVEYLDKEEVNPSLLERTIRYAIEHKQTEARLRQEAARAELLSKITRDFAAAGWDERALAQAITRRIAEAFGDTAIIRMLADDGETLELLSVDHPVAEEKDQLAALLSRKTLLLGGSIAGEVARLREPRLLCDASLEELAGEGQEELEPWFSRYPAGSILLAPLCTPSSSLGVLEIIRMKRSGAITAEDQAFYLDLAARAAMAIENALLHEELQRLAVTDPLTNLYNRRGFLQLAQRELDRSLRYGNPLALIMLDLDYLKSMNDTYGHAFGDEVLKFLAASCAVHIRRMDIACRYGGDEFIILLPETNLATATGVAHRIRACFAEKAFFPPGNTPLHLSASLGVSRVTKQTETLDQVIAQADQALYTSKLKGRNRVEVLE